MTYEDESRVQILVILPGVVFVEFFRLPSIDGEEVSPRLIGSDWVDEIFKGGMESR